MVEFFGVLVMCMPHVNGGGHCQVVSSTVSFETYDECMVDLASNGVLYGVTRYPDLEPLYADCFETLAPPGEPT